MSGNSIGKLLTLTTFGESHGPAIGGILDGCPPGIKLSEEDLQPDLDRRRPGRTKNTTQRREVDLVKLLSGVFEGETTGTSIGMLIENSDQKSKDYSAIKEKFRPAHADYAYEHKYGVRDYRGGGRSSARETAVRVAGGGIAKQVLKTLAGVEIYAYLSQMGPHKIGKFDRQAIETNDFFCPDADLVPILDKEIDDLRRAGDSCGALVTVVATGVPPGWGEPVFDRLDADIAKALMCINAVKGVEIGAGMSVAGANGSMQRDELRLAGFTSNHAGGTLGGISSGQDIVANLALKPTSSIRIPGQTIDKAGNETEVVTNGRHDPCVGIRAVPIAEAMLALTLADHFLRFRGQCADVNSETPVIPACY
jgi:chorismate synthase